MNTSPQTGAAGVADVIASLPDPLVLGLPGGHMMRVFDELSRRRDRVRTLLVRHESVATVMAEAHGRLTGRPAVVLAQGAWVFGGGGIGVMEAHLGCSPVILLIDATEGGSYSHHGPYQAGGGGYGAYDLVAGMRAITKETFLALDPVQAVQMTQLAAKHAVTGEPGPVAVVFHSRSLIKPLQGKSASRLFLDRSYQRTRALPLDVEAIEDACGAIRSARRPVIVAGNGVRFGAGVARLRAFAQQTGIPVVTTAGGKGVFPENTPLSAGVMGSFGHATANAVLAQADVVVAVGTKLSATDTANENPSLIDPQRQRLIQIDREPLNTGWTLPVDVQIVGDAADTLAALGRALSASRWDGEEHVSSATGEFGLAGKPPLAGSAVMRARTAVRILNEELPANSVVTCDAGENRLFMLHDFLVRDGGTMLQPNGGGGMGYAVPAAMTAAIVGDRRAVAVCGDGGYAMSLTALMSAIELNLSLTVVVLDNKALGWVLHGQGEQSFASELAPFDLAGIAAAMGCFATTASTPDSLRKALRESNSQPGVSVIVVRTSLEDSYLDIASPLVARHVETVSEPSH